MLSLLKISLFFSSLVCIFLITLFLNCQNEESCKFLTFFFFYLQQVSLADHRYERCLHACISVGNKVKQVKSSIKAKGLGWFLSVFFSRGLCGN